MSRASYSEARAIALAYLRENRILQRIEHPFIISYLGFAETKDGNEQSGYIMYFEYCEFGDLYAMHVLQEQPSLPVDDNETELLAQLGNFGVKAQDPDIPKPKVT